MNTNPFQNSQDLYQKRFENANLAEDQSHVSTFMTKVYGWMFLGLMLTAIVAFYTASSEALLQIILGNRILFFGLIIGQLFLVGFLAVRIQKMSAAVATMVFLGYSILNGLTFSLILLAFTAGSLFTVFAITAGTFGIMSAVGYFTKQDLSSFGKIMFMGLIGIILASLVNFFMKSETL